MTKHNITGYRVVQGSPQHTLQSAVEGLLIEGWEPLGGVTFDGCWLLQAMIYREEPKQ